MAATRAAMLKWPKACDPRRWRIGSSTIISVPITVRIVSGRKRMRSEALNPKLAGIGGLRWHPRRMLHSHLEWHVHQRLLQHARGGPADGWQERLRIDAHPHHHRDERNYHRPFAQGEVGHAPPHLFLHLAIEHALVHPEHVAGREDHADGGVDGPLEVGNGCALERKKLAHEIVP